MLHEDAVKPDLSRKFAKRWCGPYIILKKITNVNFVVKKIENK